MNTAVNVENVSKTFRATTGSVEAVKDVSFSIPRGEVVALLGENGAGKSTLIDMLLGLSVPSSGSVELMSESPVEAVRHSLVSAMLQAGGLLKELTVKDQVAMVASTYKNSTGAQQVLTEAGITDIASQKIGKCSGGQQQKVKFAIALLGNPEILILDEPTTGMDVNARKTFWDSMHALADAGKTIIFATHYLEEAEEFADRIIMMAHGQVIADGTTTKIRTLNGLRKISFSLPGEQHLELTPEQKQLWGITNLISNGTEYSMRCASVENFLPYVLSSYEVSDLQIIRPTLAEAFSKLAHA
ncbi:ABC transporter ATP-binding protein [Rothia terrae]|uniref:ABC transporter ATP-binding protein n=1 Tax=Rothia terrae TaxID=396015 RepID=A0A7H2BFE1_9MICC|nr:ABC transporter ATP-binding protein [Rothia terrae]QNV38387.1 ABC transporter ATP-binding protein [Rothia terrae]